MYLLVTHFSLHLPFPFSTIYLYEFIMTQYRNPFSTGIFRDTFQGGAAYFAKQAQV
jgi:hypothetical protein